MELLLFLKVDRLIAKIHVLPRLRPIKGHERSYGSRINGVQNSADECKY